jgi:hypothetical protein
VYLEGKGLRAVVRLLIRPTGSKSGLLALLQALDELIDQRGSQSWIKKSMSLPSTE